MGVRGTEMGRRPIAKSVEFSSVPGREGHHLLGQSLKSTNPLFAALFGFGPLAASAVRAPRQMRVCDKMCKVVAYGHVQ